MGNPRGSRGLLNPDDDRSSNMSATDFLQLPVAVQVLVVVLLWPAIWAAAAFLAALAGDVFRERRGETPPAWRKAA